MRLVAGGILTAWFLFQVGVSFGQEPQPMDADFFEAKVRPLLIARCLECHGETKPKAALRLDSRAAILVGGESGPAAIAGKPDESLLIEAIRYRSSTQMPPKSRLAEADIVTLTEWVRRGLPWPNSPPVTPEPPTTAPTSDFTAEQKAFWAFQPVIRPVPPAIDRATWVRSPIDRFILAELVSNGLQPAPEVDKRRLIRRITVDLIGLLPTFGEVTDFTDDESPDSIERVADRLLASPRYGERWARHWLDVARYADSNGLDENLAYGNAWRYRDYVVRAFRDDKPYDQFLIEQIAGDLLEPGERAAVSSVVSSANATEFDPLIATGFLCLGAKMLAEDDPVKMQMDIIDEQVDTIARTVMGLTMGCARCHDHKFDPLTIDDYYSLAGVFKSTQTMDTFSVVARWHERPLATQSQIQQRDAQQELVTRQHQIIDKLRAETAVAISVAARLPLFDFKSSSAVPKEIETLFPAEVVAQLKAGREELSRREASVPIISETMAVSESKPENLRIHLRGSHLTLGKEVPRRLPRILNAKRADELIVGSGRLPLAQWLASREHPLTSRVMVNRIWQWHFGFGLVRSPDNFGRLGDRPSHPKLLDWLASEFAGNGPPSADDVEATVNSIQNEPRTWSIKSLHRQLVASSAYRQSTEFNANAVLADPENRLLWRFHRRRMDVEVLRDSLLGASGLLDETPGGTLLPTTNRTYVTSTTNVNPALYNSNRRSIYLPVIRSALFDVFTAFDFADPSTPAGQRDQTTVAPQALFMMNSAFILEHSREIARRLLESPDSDAVDRIRRLYHLTCSRDPVASEIRRATDYTDRMRQAIGQANDAEKDIDIRVWTSLCRAILATNEFVYIE